MNKLLIVTLGTLLAVMGSCTTVDVQKPSTHEVRITCDQSTAKEVPKEDNAVVRRVMNVPFTDPELPSGSYIIGDTGYMVLWAYISVADALNLFKTVKVLQHKNVQKLHIIINSGGGSAFDGMAVADLIIRASKDGMEVMTEANGLVASAAVPIFAAGAKRIASKGTVFMLHDIKIGKMFAYEGKEDLLAQQRMIEIEENRYTSLLSERSKLSKAELKEMCRDTTWFTAEKALEYGLVDEIR